MARTRVESCSGDIPPQHRIVLFNTGASGGGRALAEAVIATAPSVNVLVVNGPASSADPGTVEREIVADAYWWGESALIGAPVHLFGRDADLPAMTAAMERLNLRAVNKPSGRIRGTAYPVVATITATNAPVERLRNVSPRTEILSRAHRPLIGRILTGNEPSNGASHIDPYLVADRVIEWCALQRRNRASGEDYDVENPANTVVDWERIRSYMISSEGLSSGEGEVNALRKELAARLPIGAGYRFGDPEIEDPRVVDDGPTDPLGMVELLTENQAWARTRDQDAALSVINRSDFLSDRLNPASRHPALSTVVEAGESAGQTLAISFGDARPAADRRTVFVRGAQRSAPRPASR